MNQSKIRKFISCLRKEKNMTQQELADRLGISDKTVSKWENGRGMPDLSLIKPLCDILDISINDLLSGERIEESNYKEKLEENIMNTINYTDNKINKTARTFKIIIGIIIAFVLSLFLMFWIDVRRMNKGENTRFCTWGFEYTPSIKLDETNIYYAIKEYLVKNDDNKFKTFVSMRIYLLEEKNNKYDVYAFVKEGRYYLEGFNVIEDGSSAIPYKFTVLKDDNGYYVSNFKVPRSGNYYDGDMKSIFPKSVRDELNKVYYDGTSEKLEKELMEQVNLYYHK